MFDLGMKQINRVQWVQHPEYLVFFRDGTMTTYCAKCSIHYPADLVSNTTTVIAWAER